MHSKIFFIILFVSQSAFCLETIALKGTSKLIDPKEAEAEILEKTTLKLATDAIKSFIGEKRFNNNKDTVSDIIKNKINRFVPFINSGNLLKSNEEYQMLVTFKISYEDLRQILKQSGLFKVSSDDLIILPMISVIDTMDGEIYAWWLGTNNNLSDMVVDIFKKKFLEASKKIKVIEPDQKHDDLKGTSFGTNDYIKLGKKFKTDLVLVGDIKFSNNRRKLNQVIIRSNFYAISVTDGKVVGEIKDQTFRNRDEALTNETLLKVSSNIIDTTVKAIITSWNNGEIGANIIYLSLSGDTTYTRVEELKKVFKKTFPEVFSFKEYIFKKDRIVFKLESNLSTRQIAQGLSKLRLKKGSLTRIRSIGNRRVSASFRK